MNASFFWFLLTKTVSSDLPFRANYFPGRFFGVKKDFFRQRHDVFYFSLTLSHFHHHIPFIKCPWFQRIVMWAYETSQAIARYYKKRDKSRELLRKRQSNAIVLDPHFSVIPFVDLLINMSFSGDNYEDKFLADLVDFVANDKFQSMFESFFLEHATKFTTDEERK